MGTVRGTWCNEYREEMGRLKKKQNKFGRSVLERQTLFLWWGAIKYPEEDGLH